MGADLFRKYVTSSVIICYRSVLNHPFLVGMILFLFSMHRLFPLLFSILVSASPVLVSTAVLLGTLLSYGHPNIPEIEEEPESKQPQIQKLESRVMSQSEIVESLPCEETNGSRIEEISRVSDANLVDDGLLQFGEIDEEKLGSHYSPLQQSEDEHIVLESDKLWEGSADPLNSNSGLLWKVNGGGSNHNDDDDDDDDGGGGDGDDDDDDDGSESRSDVAESSSPDASMADIIPMLDELHPLLSEEQETHQPSHVSRDAVSEHSLESGDTSSESNDDTGVENHESLEIEDKEHMDKEDDTITWTEDDQKNLMNLGTSELERNRRLENLIARRRARKTMRMQAEKNLIDLESSDLSWNIPPISTARNNPFDYDANDDIPGSAPSVLLQRRNPFDLPYDSSEEKPDLVGDTFQQEFATVQPKEPFFRRHESFNVGPSVFGPSRSERQESKLKPYFVPERSFASFQRQFSGLSDSKASSVPDTESISSDVENKDHIEEEEHGSEVDEHVSDHVSHARPYFVPEHVDETRFSSFQRQLSEVSESKVSSEPDTESVSSAGDVENKDHIDLSVQPDRISLEDHEHASGIISVESVTHQQELHSSGSSLSSSDEASEQIYNEKDGDEVAPASVSETDYFLDRRDSSIERSEIDVTGFLVETSHPNEPVYDLSPRSVTRNLSSSSILIDLHKDESFQHTDAQNQVPAVPDDEEHVLAARSHETFHQEDVMSQPDEESLLGRFNDKPLPEDLDELQAHDIDDISQPQEEFPLLDPSVNEPLEESHEVLQVQIQDEFANIETKAEEILAYASDTHSIESNIGDADEIKEIDEDLLMELDAVGDFSVKDYGSTLNEMKEDPNTSEHDLETSHSADEVYYSRDLGSTVDEMKNEYGIETKCSGDEDSDYKDLGTTLDEMKHDPSVLDHDLETMVAGDEDSISKGLGPTLDEMELDPHVLDHVLETKHFEEMEQDTNALDHDLETNHCEEKKQNTHVSEHDLESKHSEDDDSYSKEATLYVIKQDPHESSQNLETEHSEDDDADSKDATLDEMKQDPHESSYDLGTKHSGDDDSDSKDATLEEMKSDPRESSQDLETKRREDEDSYSKDASLEEIKQDPHALDHAIETKHSEDEDFFSKDATLEQMKQDPHASDHDLETKRSEDEDSYSKDTILDEMKQESHALDHDLETKHFEDEDSYSKAATLNELKQDPHESGKDLETKHSGDEDSLGSTLDEMKKDPRVTNHIIDEDFDSNDLDITFSEMKQGTHALEHRLETFYSVDDNFYSKHVESTFNEMKHDLHPSDQDLETKHSGETKVTMDTEVMKSHSENDISNTKVEGTFEAEASGSKLTSDANEVVLTQETESTTSLTDSASSTTVNHETENASTTSITDKE